jgi:hypothetical protein
MEGPTTRELPLLRINSATKLDLTVPCSSLSLIRLVFRRRLSSHCYSPHSVFSRASHLRGPRVRHSGEEKVRTRLGAKSDSRTISFVSYFSFVSKGVGIPKVHS